jgi:hypothetical protein
MPEIPLPDDWWFFIAPDKRWFSPISRSPKTFAKTGVFWFKIFLWGFFTKSWGVKNAGKS